MRRQGRCLFKGPAIALHGDGRNGDHSRGAFHRPRRAIGMVGLLLHARMISTLSGNTCPAVRTGQRPARLSSRITGSKTIR